MFWPVYLLVSVQPISSVSFHHCIPLCLCPAVVSQLDNGKTFSVSSTIRIPVERKDNGAALSCEAIHPALGGQKRIRHYRLDVYCKSFLTCALCIKTPSSILETDEVTLIAKYFKRANHPIRIDVTDVLFITAIMSSGQQPHISNGGCHHLE